MKKFLIAAMMAIAFTAQAQSYDNQHKYDLFSNLEIGISGQYSYAIEGKAGNWGADVRVTKRLGNNWRMRGIADFNGFGRKDGFDRYAKVMAGMSADFLPFYIFADYGVSFNPSAHQKFNPAGDAGIGLHFDIGRGLRLFTEAGADRTANGNNVWHSDAFVKVGYAYNLGITENDRKEIDVDRHVHSEYGELKQENQLLKSEVKKCSESATMMQEAAAQMQQMVLSLQAQLEKKDADNKFLQDNCGSVGDWNIYFPTGSCHITSQMDDVIADIAEAMLGNNKHYKIDGYASNNGSPLRNIELAQGRAEAVFQRLVEYGVDPTRLLYAGNGSTDYDRQGDQRAVITPITNN